MDLGTKLTKGPGKPFNLKIAVVTLLFITTIYAGIFIKENYDGWFVYPGLRTQLSSQMRDPQSTQFKDEKLASNGALCGLYNAKNTYGAYTGFKRFIAGYQNVYIEDGGRLNANENNEYMIDILNMETSILRELIKNIPIDRPTAPISKDDLRARAQNNIFNKNWKEVCP